MPNRFVLTGGPGFGKTTLLDELAMVGCSVFPEAARSIIRSQGGSGDPVLPWLDRRRFDNVLIQKMLEDYYHPISTDWAVFDRGFPDLIGWRVFAGLDYQDVVELVSDHPYRDLVFVTEPWEEIYETNDERPYSFAEARRINEILAATYESLGYVVEYVPRVDAQARARLVIDRIQAYLG